MPEKVLHQIKHLCRNIAKVEWSGVLFYKVEGSIRDPKEMVLTLEDILPMNKGTQAYTEYTFDEKVIEHMMENEHLEECKIGHIHSHNTMAVFFSGTDWSELEDNAPNHNFYLSLIVNNFMDFCAKVCFISEATDSHDFSFWAKDENGKKYVATSQPFSVKAKKLMVYDCDIQVPTQEIIVSEDFATKTEAIITKAAKIDEANKAKFATTASTTRPWETPTVGKHASAAGFKPNQTSWQRPAWQNEDTDASDWEPKFQEPAKKEKADTDISLDIVEFAMLVLNTGSTIDDYADCEDVIEYYLQFNLTPNALRKSVIEAYPNLYQKHVVAKDPGANSPEGFVLVTEAIIEEYIDSSNLTIDAEVKKMLFAVVDGLEAMLEQFNKVIKE